MLYAGGRSVFYGCSKIVKLSSCLHKASMLYDLLKIFALTLFLTSFIQVLVPKKNPVLVKLIYYEHYILKYYDDKNMTVSTLLPKYRRHVVRVPRFSIYLYNNN